MLLTHTKRSRKKSLEPNSPGSSTSARMRRDYMGHLFEKKVTTDGALHERYLYRDYLQIAAVDLLANTTKHAILWDPTQPTATRPLAIQQGKEWYTYAWDLTKNITALFTPDGVLSTTYTYTPYGKVTSDGDIDQPIQWSSEMHDIELGLVYYNYRYYNPTDGRWIRRDFIGMVGGLNWYIYLSNYPVNRIDRLGLRTVTIPPPSEPIFTYPYGYDDSHGNTRPGVAFPKHDDFKKLYQALESLHTKERDGKRCYNVYLHTKGPAIVKAVTYAPCDYKFIIGHGRRDNRNEYVRLKDGEVCINTLQKNGCQCQAYGCDVGETTGKTTYLAALYLLIKDITALTTSSECPCPPKRVCIFSGPVNQ